MPASFDRCRSQGGKMRTISGPNKQAGLSSGEYRHVCIDKSGNMHLGEIKKKHQQIQEMERRKK